MLARKYEKLSLYCVRVMTTRGLKKTIFIAYKQMDDWGLNTFSWINKTTLEVQLITEDKEVKDSFVITKPSVSFLFE